MNNKYQIEVSQEQENNNQLLFQKSLTLTKSKSTIMSNMSNAALGRQDPLFESAINTISPTQTKKRVDNYDECQAPKFYGAEPIKNQKLKVIFKKSLHSKSHNSFVNSAFVKNSKSIISIEGSGQRKKDSLFPSKSKLKESNPKTNLQGGKFVNIDSDIKDDQVYNNVKVVEVGSEMNDLKDESLLFGTTDLRINNTMQQSSMRELSPESQFNITRRLLGSMEEYLIQIRNLMNKYGSFDKLESENGNNQEDNDGASFNHQLNGFVEKLTQQLQKLSQHLSCNQQVISQSENQVKSQQLTIEALTQRLEDLQQRNQISQQEIERLEKDDEKQKLRIQSLNHKVRELQDKNKQNILSMMKQNSDNTAGDSCPSCGSIKVLSQQIGSVQHEGQELIQLQNKYSSIIQQKSVKIMNLEDQILKSQNQLEDQKHQTYQDQKKLTQQNKKLQNDMVLLKADKEKYHAQKDKLQYQNMQLMDQLKGIQVQYNKLKDENTQLLSWRAQQRQKEIENGQKWFTGKPEDFFSPQRHNRVNTFGEHFDTNIKQVDSGVHGNEGQQEPQAFNQRIEDDDIETRKGASGGNQNEGPLIDLQQIHLFQFGKGESPGMKNKQEQQFLHDKRSKNLHGQLINQEYATNHPYNVQKQESMYGRLNASYQSKQDSSMIIANVTNSFRRSYSCLDVTQLMSKTSKASPNKETIISKGHKLSKSIDSPPLKQQRDTGYKSSKLTPELMNEEKVNAIKQQTSQNAKIQQHMMTFVNQNVLVQSIQENDYPYQNNAVLNTSNFYRDSYENQDLKNVIFHGQSPGTMLKIPQKGTYPQESFKHSILDQSKRSERAKIFDMKNSRRKNSEEDDFHENKSDNSPVRIRSNMQSLVLTDQKSIKTKQSNKKVFGLGYTHAKRIEDKNAILYGDRSDFYREHMTNGFQEIQDSKDINHLQMEIQNRINFAIMKIDQMTVAQVNQSGFITNNLDRSRLENGQGLPQDSQSNFGQSQYMFNQNFYEPNEMHGRSASQNFFDFSAAMNANFPPECTPQGKYPLERRGTEITDNLCYTGRTNTSHITINTQRQVNEHSQCIKNTLLQLRQLVNERLEEERKRKMDISAQKRFFERTGDVSQKSQSQVVDIKRLRRNINMDNKDGLMGEGVGKSNYGNNYKKEKKLSKSNANYQKFLTNLHQDEKRWQRYVDVLNNQMTIDPNALKNKYLKSLKEQDTSLHIHRHLDEDQIEEIADDNGGQTDRTNRTRKSRQFKDKHLKSIMNLQKSYIEAKEKEKDKLRDNIHRRRQVLESQEKNLSTSPSIAKKLNGKVKTIRGGAKPLQSIKAVIKGVQNTKEGQSKQMGLQTTNQKSSTGIISVQPGMRMSFLQNQKHNGQ